MKNLLTIILFITILHGCTHKQQVQNAMYIWNSKVSLPSNSIDFLQKQNITKLYIHLFDVVWNKQRKNIEPLAIMNPTSSLSSSFEYIPTIYITVECLYKSTNNDMDTLASHILQTTQQICKKHCISFSELQIDCDWTPETKYKFFSLLHSLSNRLHAQKKLLSTTIRLHQIKYYKKTGIPPVDKGMLMFYNMGEISCNSNKNSIYNEEDADKYSDYIRAYPLPLDIALPLFSWGIVCNNSKIKSIVNSIDDLLQLHAKDFKTINNTTYIAQKSFLYKGMYITKDDAITVEKINPEQCKKAAKYVSEKISLHKLRTISIFDYSSIIQNKYEGNSLQAIYNQFN